ncbi:MAG TPA: hypothetical protein VHA52_13855, partial [Candidatus Babeliaceae bacterium]|nr:hypothetical protein [Candidatus Babeliaceae bacterium]
MKDSIGLYFQIEIGDSDQALFLIKESLKEIEELEQVGIPVAYLQLRAKELPSRLANKEIWLKIDSARGTYMASHVSFE